MTKAISELEIFFGLPCKLWPVDGLMMLHHHHFLKWIWQSQFQSPVRPSKLWGVPSSIVLAKIWNMLSIYVAIHDARRLIHVCCFSSLMLCLCCMLRESYTSRCDTITICMQQQRSCMLVLRAAQHKHKEREGLEYNRRAVFENRRESLHIC